MSKHNNTDTDTDTVKPSMGIFTATMIAEGVDSPESEEQYLEAWQLLVDTGTCWQLQGWFGRTATSLINAGHVTPAV